MIKWLSDKVIMSCDYNENTMKDRILKAEDVILFLDMFLQSLRGRNIDYGDVECEAKKYFGEGLIR